MIEPLGSEVFEAGAHGVVALRADEYGVVDRVEMARRAVGEAVERASEYARRHHGGARAVSAETEKYARHWGDNIMFSDVAASKWLGCGPKKYARESIHFIAAAVALERRDVVQAFRQLAYDIVRKGGAAMTFTEAVMYDETTMKSKVKDDAELVAPRNSSAQRAVVSADGLAVSKTSQSANTKLLQTRRAYAMLFELGGQFLHVEAECTVWLQAMSRGTAEVYYECLSDTACDMDDVSSNFRRRQRFAMNDGDGAVEKCERAFAEQTVSLRPKCVVHKIATDLKNTVLPMESCVSGMSNASLALSSSQRVQTFRSTLRALLSSCLVWNESTQPSARDLRYASRVLQLFLPDTSKRCSLRRAIVLSLLNGAYDQPEIVHNCRGCCFDRNHCLQKLGTFFVGAVCSASPPTWPRHRWRGADKAVEYFGLLEATHGLFPRTFFLWQSTEHRGASLTSIHVGSSGLVDGALVDHNPTLELEASGSEDEQRGKPAAPRADNDSRPREAASAPSFRKELQGYRNKALKWLWRGWERRAVLAELVVLRVVMGPLQQLLNAHYDMASDEWDVAEQARWAGSALGGSPRPARQYRVAMAARSVHERDALAELESLLTNGAP